MYRPRTIWFLAAGLVTALLPAAPAPAAPADTEHGGGRDLAGFVNPFVGAKAGQNPDDNTYAGDTFPGADVPFGMVQWSPDSPLQPKGSDGDGRYYVGFRDGGYAWEDNRLRGFSLTHFNGAGCGGAAGDVPFLPYLGTPAVSPAADPARYLTTYSHDHETASPGYYKVTADTGITSELTVTRHSGAGRFTFPAGQAASMLVNVAASAMGTNDASVTIDPATRTISGWAASGHFCRGPNTYKVYFTATFDRPFTAYGTWHDAALTPGSRQSGGGNLTEGAWDKQTVKADGGSGAYVTFDLPTASANATSTDRPASESSAADQAGADSAATDRPGGGRSVGVRVGLSYVDLDGARRNMVTEQRGEPFDGIARRARRDWNARLNQIAVDGGTLDQRRTFYTALYHTLLQPNVFSDVDGRYVGFDRQIHRAAPGHAQYANFSGWDVYRDSIQLQALLAPDEAADMAQSMFNQATQAGGIWDRWSQNNDFMGVMAGDPYHSMIASIYAFGGRNFDARGALDSMVRGATRVQPPGERALERPGLPDYLTLGYHPDNVSDLLEETTADFGIAQLAGRLGRRTTERQFMARAQYWQNVYNPATGYLQPRLRDGRFRTPFDPAKHEEFQYQEGNAAQYTWMVPYNVRGLFDAMGGNDAVTKRLDFFFTKLNTDADSPYAFMANEPSFEVPWEYAWAGAPYKTQDVVRRSAELLFHPTPDGLPGNDDLGATSAWYVWAALGMYPQIPGRAELVLASPLFPHVVITRGSGQRIVIDAPAASADAKYVHALRVDGRPSTKPWLPESFVTRGGRLDYTLATTPDTRWGGAPADAPPSFRDGEVPVRGTTSPARLVLAPGGAPTTATIGAERITGTGTITWTAHPPTGVTVTPASGRLAAGATQPVSVTAAAGHAEGFAAIPVTFDNGQLPASLAITVARPGMLPAAYDNAGIGDDTKGWLAGFGTTDLYPGTFSYSAQALATQGITPGATVRANGLTYTWPSSAPGQPDNVLAAGQILDLSSAPAGTTALSFLGAATEGDAHGTATLTYTDGTTQTADLGLSEWLLRGGAEQPQFGNTVVATTPYINSTFPRYIFRLQRGFTAYVFATAPIPIDPTKHLKSVTLPPTTLGGTAHLFTYGLR